MCIASNLEIQVAHRPSLIAHLKKREAVLPHILQTFVLVYGYKYTYPSPRSHCVPLSKSKLKLMPFPGQKRKRMSDPNLTRNSVGCVVGDKFSPNGLLSGINFPQCFSFQVVGTLASSMVVWFLMHVFTVLTGWDHSYTYIQSCKIFTNDQITMLERDLLPHTVWFGQSSSSSLSSRTIRRRKFSTSFMFTVGLHFSQCRAVRWSLFYCQVAHRKRGRKLENLYF